MYDIIISFGLYNNGLDDILLAESFDNKIMVMLFDRLEKMPVDHLIGRKRPSLLYFPLPMKTKVIHKRSTVYPFKKVEEVNLHSDDPYRFYFQNNRSILFNYTEEYEEIKDDIIAKYGDNIKNVNLRSKTNSLEHSLNTFKFND